MKMIQLRYDSEFREAALPILTNPEYQLMKQYMAHGHYTVYSHCFRVALFAYSYAKSKNMDIDYTSLIRGCLLHDYYLYDWHHLHEGHRLHGFRHPYFALRNAKKRFQLNRKERNMILSHMFPLTFWTIPLSKEAWLLTHADKVCARMESASVRKKTVRRKQNLASQQL